MARNRRKSSRAMQLIAQQVRRRTGLQLPGPPDQITDRIRPDGYYIYDVDARKPTRRDASAGGD